MPRILDNLSPEATLLSTLRTTLELSHRADFCVGYFNLRGWKHVDEYVEPWAEYGQQARILVGMQKPPHDELREALSMLDARAIDNQRALRLKQRLAEQFRDQLVIGAPTNNDEAALQRLVKQLKDGKVVVSSSCDIRSTPSCTSASAKTLSARWWGTSAAAISRSPACQARAS